MQKAKACLTGYTTVVTGIIAALGVAAESPGTGRNLPSTLELKIGERAPEIAAWTLSGNVYDYQPPDKTVFLSFWSMKDPSYTSYFEHLSRMRTEFADVPDFLMISVLIDDDSWDALSEYCVRQGKVKYGSGKPIRFLDDARWWQLIVMENQAGESMLEKYGIESTPQSFLLGPRGVLIECRIPFKEIREVVAKHVTLAAKETLSGTRDEGSLNGASFAFRFCPPGEFWMGSEEEVRARYEDRLVPRHRVRLTRGFWLQETEVTQSQYIAIAGAKPSFWGSKRTHDHPVERVSWEDARRFCEKLSQLDTGAGYRLPTEAEWEYACRAGTTGPTYGKLEDIAWYFENTGVGDGTGSHGHRPVRSKEPNAWGLYDMLGNVEEWCSDWSGPPAANKTTDPTGPLAGRARRSRQFVS